MLVVFVPVYLFAVFLFLQLNCSCCFYLGTQVENFSFVFDERKQMDKFHKVLIRCDIGYSKMMMTSLIVCF